MDINALNAFIAVARRESFSAAAKDLYLTQPAVSKRVASLEQELGFKLFHRVARQVALTEAGQQLLPRALELVGHADDMLRFAANLGTEICGTLSVSISHHIGLHRMPPILRDFNTSYAKVALDIHFEDSDYAFEQVEQGEVEFAVITLPNRVPEKLYMEPIWRDPLSIVVGCDHLLASANLVDAVVLLDHPCVLTEKLTETYKVVADAIDQSQQKLNVQMVSNNLESLKMLVGAGIGWSALPVTMLDDSLSVVKTPLQLERQLGMVFHHKRSLSNAAQALASMIRNHKL